MTPAVSVFHYCSHSEIMNQSPVSTNLDNKTTLQFGTGVEYRTPFVILRQVFDECHTQ